MSIRALESPLEGSPNFSYSLIDEGQTIEIAEGQQMLFCGHLSVLGHLTVSGELIDVCNEASDNGLFFYTKIPADEVVIVEPDRLLLYRAGMFTVDGHLIVRGNLLEI
jgi:hypothetical protein